MTYSSAILARAGLTNPHVHEFVAEWARILTPDRIEVVDADADERRPGERPRGRSQRAHRPVSSSSGARLWDVS